MSNSAPASTADHADQQAAAAFIQRWQGNTASELSTAQSFVTQLCDLLGVASPHPTVAQDYIFERPITFAHGDGSSSAGRIDCYKHGHFVLEAKKTRLNANTKTFTKRFDDALLRARAQGEGYARALPFQVSAIAQLLAGAGTSLSLADIAASFKGKGPWKKGLPRILETFEALGRARREGDGWRGL